MGRGPTEREVTALGGGWAAAVPADRNADMMERSSIMTIMMGVIRASVLFNPSHHSTFILPIMMCEES